MKRGTGICAAIAVVSLVASGCGTAHFDKQAKQDNVPNITDCRPTYTLKAIDGGKMRVCEFTDPNGRHCIQSREGGTTDRAAIGGVSCDPMARQQTDSRGSAQ